MPYPQVFTTRDLEEAVFCTLKRNCFTKVEAIAPAHVSISIFTDEALTPEEEREVRDAVDMTKPVYWLVDIVPCCWSDGKPWKNAPKLKKYPGECPCGIAAMRCEYHRDM